MTAWIDEDIASCWKQAAGSRLRGGQLQYSHRAIEACLVLRKVYGLPLRQTEGFIKSIFKLAGIILRVPDYTTLCRRSNGLKVNLSAVSSGEVADMVVDSTGLKVYGEGEWKVRKHGAGKHRTWMKLHIAANSESQQIEAMVLTTNAVTDAAAVDTLLAQTDKPVKSFCGDGAYDQEEVRKALHSKGIKQNIPPQRNAILDKKQSSHMKERDEAIQTIAEQGRETWKKLQGYHQRSKAETAMFRYKTIIGGNLVSRKTEYQKTEAAIGCKILNIMLQLSKPLSVKTA